MALPPDPRTGPPPGPAAPAPRPGPGSARRVAERPGPVAVLVGPPGAGKSTIGRRLSRALSTTLTDVDDLISAREGAPCGAVLRNLGEPRFREIEEEEVARALAAPGVVSLGGGAVLSERTREALADHVVVYLEVDVDEGVRRTSRDASRPLLAGDPAGAGERYRALYEARRALYEEVATITVRSDSRPPQRVVAELLAMLEAGGGD